MASLAPPTAGAAWEALGTSVALRVTRPATLPQARAAVELELDAIDRACSRFRPDSELARVNAAAGRPVQVSPLLMEALELALRAAELTDGDVDPTLGRALELAGYDRDWTLLEAAAGLPAKPPTLSARVLSGWRALDLDPSSSTVRLPRGISLDLGATAKAWAADRAAAAAARVGGCGALVGIGGDIATSGTAPDGGWQIHVTDDHRSDPAAAGQTVTILSGGLATSSTAVRRWSHAGYTMHHIIDPRTGSPVQSTWRTVSVAAASCAEANIATTAALVQAQAAPEWLTGLALPARLVAWDGSVTSVASWPEESER
ncbi:MAG TPA: FAD:protein FMN transferase [Solirubrobacteraceae bacterium]|jgi:thiamine biosynthesis lipoprotein|nr:FAD:protein FMN transferase [Solirubrobacteraceae bacterium]